MPQGPETQPLSGVSSYGPLLQSLKFSKELVHREVKEQHHGAHNGMGTVTESTTTPRDGALGHKVAAMESPQKGKELEIDLSSLDTLGHLHLHVSQEPPQSQLPTPENIFNAKGASPCLTGWQGADIIETALPPTPALVAPVKGSSRNNTQATEAKPLVQASSPDPLPAPPGNTNGAIFRNEFFEIRSSPVSGFGVFAVKDLRYGDVILAEHPLLRTTARLVFRDFENLNEEGKRAYMSLTGFSMKKTAHIVEKILLTNSFQVPGGVAIFSVASRFNHACKPIRNVLFRFDQRCGMMKFTVAKNRVPAGKELRINYGGTPIEFYRVWGFRCSCGACSPVSDRELGIICKETWCT